MNCIFCERPATSGVRYVYMHAIERAEVHAEVCQACYAERWSKEKRRVWLQSIIPTAIVGLMIYFIPSYIAGTGLPTTGRVVLWIVFLFLLLIPFGGTLELFEKAYDRTKALEHQVYKKLWKDHAVRLDPKCAKAEWFGESVQTDPVKRAWELGKTGDANAVRPLIELSASTSVKVRRAATSSLEQLWWTASPEAIQRLIKMLGDTDTNVRATAALAIGEYVAKYAQTSGGTAAAGIELCAAAKSALLARLSDPVDEVVTNAVIALANIDDPDIVVPLARAVYQRAFASKAIELVKGLRLSDTRSAIVAEIQRLQQSQV